jgi:RNA polymerase sigma factor (sigma-70 family)
MRMAWQDMSPFPTPRMDAEEEREMRLAAQARAGAEWALAALIARYQPPVLRYLARLTGNPAQAHRLAERIFVRMERRLRGPRGAEHLRLWLLRAATEAGLDALRHPGRSRQPSRLNAPDAPRGLLTDGPSGAATDRLRAGLSKIAAITGTTRRQVRQLIWNSDEPASPTAATSGRTSEPADDMPLVVDPDLDAMNPQEELRHRLVRAVLAELPYGDAQCLALHLVAGLNQTEVARALGIRPSAARHRIVQGLQMFSHRYDAAVTSLGIPTEVAYAEQAENLLAPVDTVETVDTVGARVDARLHGRDEAYTTPASASPQPPVEAPTYHEYRDDRADGGTESATYGAVFPEVYGDEFDDGYAQDEVISAPVVAAPASGIPASAAPVIVDALPAMPASPVDAPIVTGIQDELPDTFWLDQPTMVPVLSTDPAPSRVEEPPPAVTDAPNVAPRAPVQTTPRVPVVTPPNQP